MPDEGGTESLVFQNKEWIYQKGTQQSACYYNQSGQLTHMADHDGHAFQFSYSHGELSSITDTCGKQQITWTFAQGLVQDVTVSSEGQVIHHLHYEYNEKNQLSKVSRDLGNGKSYWITYDYVADSNWIKDIKQSDGTSLHIDYDAQGRVRQLIDGEGRSTTYRYESGKTTFTNGLDDEWTYFYDEQNRLTGIDGPEHYRLRYTYEGANLKSMTQGHET